MGFFNPPNRYRYDPVESKPLPELVALCLQKMMASGVLERAGRSPVYRRSWQEAGIDPLQIHSYADFARIPLATSDFIRERLKDISPADLAGDADVRFWASTSGTTGQPKWIPVGERDIDGIMDTAVRMIFSAIDPADGFPFLALSTPAPFVSESWIYLAIFKSMLEDVPSETAIFALPESEDAMSFARKIKSRSLYAFPSMVAMIAEQVARRAVSEAARHFRKEKGLRTFFAMAAARVFRVQAKHVFRLRRGVLVGEPLAPYARAIKRSFAMEAFEGYGSTESANVGIIECSRHQGMHLPIHCCLPEIIPAAELERQEENTAFRPQAIPIWEAQPGLVGELVLTNFTEAFPLLRYRTADLVRVESTAPCACGRSHPRIRILHRCDDVVNLGLIRFSTSLLQAKLAAVSKSGCILRWRLRLTREGIRPKMRLEVNPARMDSAAALRQEILEHLDEIEGVAQGRKNGLIAEPEIRFVEAIGNDRGQSGKDRLVLYDPAYFNEA